MSISSRLDRLHSQAKENRWLQYFTVFNRIALAAGFIPSGVVKIMGERFTSLSSNHPMGHYLDALYHTGYYYTFIGLMQVTAAILLLIPRTVVLGALIYFPIIVNICILSFAVRFDGSMLSAPLMVMGDLYLLCWNYDKLKYILPFHHASIPNAGSNQKFVSNNFPAIFFAGVAGTVIILVLAITLVFSVMPRNTLYECRTQFKGTTRTKAGCDFCDCIHHKGLPLHSCLEAYGKAPDDAVQIK